MPWRARPVLDRLPVHRVVDVAVRVEIGRAQRPRHADGVRRRIGQLELRRTERPAAAAPYGPKSPIRAGRWSGPRWIQTLSISSRPPASPCTDQRRPAAIAATPLHQVAISTARSWSSGATTSTRILRITQRCVRDPPPRLLDVVDRGVLEEARDGVEPHPAGRVHVREADAPAAHERPRLGGPRQRGVEHGLSRGRLAPRRTAPPRSRRRRSECAAESWVRIRAAPVGRPGTRS